VRGREEPRSRLTHREVLAIAVPITLSNVSTPLLGVVDTAVMGRMGDPAYIGAVALGALVFSFAFWAFGFLRMGTTGLTAQAFGANDEVEIRAALGRATLIAALIGVALVALQWPIREIAFTLLGAGEKVEGLARIYFDIRIWAAPATLLNYALFGWFIGLGNARIALVLQLILNALNMLLDVVLALGLDMGVAGVALGTLIAEFAAAAAGLLYAVRSMARGTGGWTLRRVLDAEKLRRTLAVNRDIMIRSLALMVAFAWFMAHGAKQGDTTLAANALLMQFITVAAFILDGLAFAAEAQVGRAVGAGDRSRLIAAIRITTVWAAGFALLASALFALTGPVIIDFLAVDPATRAQARTYLPWAAWAPLAGVWCFQLDGIFIGATRTAEMRNAMLLALAIFLAAWWLLTPFGNTGLWAALMVHYAARAGTLLAYVRALLRGTPAGRQLRGGAAQEPSDAR